MTSNFRSLVRFFIACAVLTAQATLPLQNARATAQHVFEAEERERLTFELEFKQKSGQISSAVFDDSEGVITFQMLLNGREVWALLDTGSQATFVDVGFARELNLRVEEMSSKIRTRKRELPRSKIEGVELEVVGQFVVPSAILNGTDLSGISQALGKDIKIILGRELINAFAFYLDTRAKRIVFLPSGAMKLRDEQVTRLPMADGLLEGAINGVPALFSVDLGATGALQIRRGVWDRYISNDALLGVVPSTDLSGESFDSIFTQGVTIDIGPLRSRFAAKQVRDLHDNFEGYIGYRYFSGRRVLFDYPAGEVLIFKDTREQ